MATRAAPILAGDLSKVLNQCFYIKNGFILGPLEEDDWKFDWHQPLKHKIKDMDNAHFKGKLQIFSQRGLEHRCDKYGDSTATHGVLLMMVFDINAPQCIDNTKRKLAHWDRYASSSQKILVANNSETDNEKNQISGCC